MLQNYAIYIKGPNDKYWALHDTCISDSSIEAAKHAAEKLREVSQEIKEGTEVAAVEVGKMNRHHNFKDIVKV